VPPRIFSLAGLRRPLGRGAFGASVTAHHDGATRIADIIEVRVEELRMQLIAGRAPGMHPRGRTANGALVLEIVRGLAQLGYQLRHAGQLAAWRTIEDFVMSDLAADTAPVPGLVVHGERRQATAPDAFERASTFSRRVAGLLRATGLRAAALHSLGSADAVHQAELPTLVAARDVARGALLRAVLDAAPADCWLPLVKFVEADAVAQIAAGASTPGVRDASLINDVLGQIIALAPASVERPPRELALYYINRRS
jgi:hypothetical protein